MARLTPLTLCLSLFVAGCKQSAVPMPPAAAPASRPVAKPVEKQSQPAKATASRPRSSPFWEASNKDPGKGAVSSNTPNYVPFPKPQINQQRVEAAGIRKLAGKHLVLYTDLPSTAEIDGLCGLADQAYPQWCEYFQVDATEQPDWQMIGYLAKDKQRFEAAGLWPNDLPGFGHGFCRDYELWLYEQPSDYYRRHLLLHEMTHGFMYTRLQANAPPWYLEGIAELLATHRLSDGKLQLNYFPKRKEETPDWGRIKLVQDGFAARKAPLLGKVFDMPLEAHLQIENYGWCWAAAALLDGHPRYRDRFRQVAKDVTQSDFQTRFRQIYDADRLDLIEDWQLFVASIEYGHDLPHWAIDYQPGNDLPAGGAKVKVAADRGWQSSKLRLSGGQSYRIKASGQFDVAQEPRPWVSEANGVSIRYHCGAPLGLLSAAVRPDDQDENLVSGFFRAEPVGLEAVIRPATTGTLYLKINDSPAELADNRGSLEVQVVPIQ